MMASQKTWWLIGLLLVGTPPTALAVGTIQAPYSDCTTTLCGSRSVYGAIPLFINNSGSSGVVQAWSQEIAYPSIGNLCMRLDVASFSQYGLGSNSPSFSGDITMTAVLPDGSVLYNDDKPFGLVCATCPALVIDLGPSDFVLSGSVTVVIQAQNPNTNQPNADFRLRYATYPMTNPNCAGAVAGGQP